MIRVRNILPAVTLFCLATTLRAEDQPLQAPAMAIEQVVDHYIDAAIKADKLRAATQADDASVLRRLTLDLNGRIPTPAELDAYLADKSPDKKVRLVDRLMASPAFVRHQAVEMASLLEVEIPGGKKGQKGQLRAYLQTAVAENRSWDKIFRDIMLPDEKDAKIKGASEFIRSRLKDLNRLTIDVSTLFFGVNVSCAQCHDHPHVPDWKQDHFYGMKSFFARTVDTGGTLGERDSGGIRFIPNKGTERTAKVMFLTGKTVDVPGLDVPIKNQKGKKKADKKNEKPAPLPKISLRAKLVELALQPEQRDFFSRAIVNRTWYRLFGRGLVMPLDQMHSANPASHPELLQWLARDMVEHGYDLRRLIHGLVLSQAYSRSSRWEGDDVPADKYFAIAQVRGLAPLPMAVALRMASADPEKAPRASEDVEKYVDGVEKTANGISGFFVQPTDNFQVGVGEAMLFSNNEALLADLLVDRPGSLVSRLRQVTDFEKRAELAVRSVLSRPARPDEVQALSSFLRQRQDRSAAACQQVVWALLTSAEFRFNH